MSIEKSNESVGVIDQKKLERDKPKKDFFDDLGLKKEDLFLDPKFQDEFFELYGINKVKKEDEKVFLSCYQKKNHGARYKVEESLHIVLYGGCHTHESNVDDIVDMIDERTNQAINRTKEQSLDNEIKLSEINFEVGWLLVMAFGFRNLIKKSEFLKNEQNQIEVFIPWQSEDKMQENGVVRFLERTAARNYPNVVFHINRDRLMEEVFKEK